MSDRYELEQKILNCWNVVEDLKAKNQGGAYFDALSVVYNVKFQDMWDLFEQMISEGKIK